MKNREATDIETVTDCPTCGARRGQPCVKPSGRPTDFYAHTARHPNVRPDEVVNSRRSYESHRQRYLRQRGGEPTDVPEALAALHQRICSKSRHDAVCRILREALGDAP